MGRAIIVLSGCRFSGAFSLNVLGESRVADVRRVAPTVRDRVELLDRIVAAVAARRAGKAKDRRD